MGGRVWRLRLVAVFLAMASLTPALAQDDGQGTGTDAAPTPAEEAAASDATEDGSGTDAAESAGSASVEGTLASLDQRLQALSQSLVALEEALERDREVVADQALRLDTELQRIDPLVARLDGLAEAGEEASAALVNQQDRVEDTAIRVIDIFAQLDAFEERFERLERRIRLVRTMGQSGSEDEDSETAALSAVAGPFFGIVLSLAALLAVGFQPQGNGRARVAPLAAIWAGAGAGFVLIGTPVASSVQAIPGDMAVGLDMLLVSFATLPPDALASAAGVAALAVAAAVSLPRGLSPISGFAGAALLGAGLAPLLSVLLGSGELAGIAGPATALLLGAAVLTASRAVADQDGNGTAGPDRTPVAFWLAGLGAFLCLAPPAADPTALATAFILGGFGALAIVVVATTVLRLTGPSHGSAQAAAGLAGAVAAVAAVGGSVLEAFAIGAVGGLLFVVLRSLRHDPAGQLDIAVALTAGGVCGIVAAGIVGAQGLLELQSASALIVYSRILVVALVAAVVFGLVLGTWLRLVRADAPAPARADTLTGADGAEAKGAA